MNCQEAEAEIGELRRDREELIRRGEEVEAALRMEREKQSRHISEVLLLQKEAKDWRGKAELANEEAAKLKEECYQLRTRAKGEERNLAL